jgi:hypothetical protein
MSGKQSPSHGVAKHDKTTQKDIHALNIELHFILYGQKGKTE